MTAEGTSTPLWFRHNNFSAFFSAYQKHNARPLFFIGSGLSIGAGLPTWKQLLQQLALTTRNETLQIRISELIASSDTKGMMTAGSLLYNEFFSLGDGSGELWRKTLADLLNNENFFKKTLTPTTY